MKSLTVCRYVNLLPRAFVRITASESYTEGQLEAAFHSEKSGRVLGEVSRAFGIVELAITLLLKT